MEQESSLAPITAHRPLRNFTQRRDLPKREAAKEVKIDELRQRRVRLA